MSLDDTLLVKKLKRGSEKAFAELFERYKGRIHHVAYSVVGDAQESEDVVQEVFLKAVRNIDAFDMRSSFYTWLYRIAVNTAVDFKKKLRPLGTIPLQHQDGGAPEIASDAEPPEASPQRQEMAALLHKAMEELSDMHKKIIVLREFEELSYIEIAEILGCSKGTVESRLFRARGKLREKLERYLP